MKKILVGLIGVILVFFMYAFFFTGSKTQPSGLEISDINEIYHTSFPDSIQATSIGVETDKALFNKKESVHRVILVTDYYYCEFEMTKGETTFSSPNSEYLKHKFEIKAEDLLFEIGQYDYDTLNTEEIYKPTYILTFDYGDAAFYVMIHSMDSSPFRYKQDETIKPEESSCIEELIRENIFGL